MTIRAFPGTDFDPDQWKGDLRSPAPDRILRVGAFDMQREIDRT